MRNQNNITKQIFSKYSLKCGERNKINWICWHHLPPPPPPSLPSPPSPPLLPPPPPLMYQWTRSSPREIARGEEEARRLLNQFQLSDQSKTVWLLKKPTGLLSVHTNVSILSSIFGPWWGDYLEREQYASAGHTELPTVASHAQRFWNKGVSQVALLGSPMGLTPCQQLLVV